MSVVTSLQALSRYAKALLFTPWLLLRFILDVCFCILPWTRPIKKWSLNAAARVRIVRLVLQYWSLTQSGNYLNLWQGRERNRFEVILPAPSTTYRGPLSDAQIRPDTLGMTWTPSRLPPAKLVHRGITVALHFHGGGFVIGNGRDEDTGYLAQTLIKHMGCTHVCTPQYRLASGRNGRFPAPVQDALTVYLELLQKKGIPASQIVLSGDSAGANIAIGLLRYISEHGKEDDIPLPGAVTIWSPWVDVNAAFHQDMTKSQYYKTDYLCREFGLWGASSITGHGIIDPLDAYVSPLNHPFELSTHIPVFVHAGDGEILYDDIRNFVDRYKKFGWQIHLAVSENCPHDILLLGSVMGFSNEAEGAAEEARILLSEATTMVLQYPAKAK